jgi:two-component system, OmpR family, phosphate regulon response regulator OmpR
MAHAQAAVEPSRAPRAVVCDADVVSARLLGRVLERAGFGVSTCHTARACRDAISSVEPNVVLLAVLLPDLDGLALVRELRAAGLASPILVVSALQAETRAAEAGANAFLLKPVDPSTLLAAVTGVRAA